MGWASIVPSPFFSRALLAAQMIDCPEDFIGRALSMSPAEASMLTAGEALIGRGFRFWLGGYQTGNFANWQRCWSLFCEEMPCNARDAIDDLTRWVNTVRCCGLRDIELLPDNCGAFGRDECLAVTLVVASEHRHCPAMQLCAQLLMGTTNVEPALDAAFRFGRTLARGGVSFADDGAAIH